MSTLTQLADAVFKGDFLGVKDITQQLIEGGTDPIEIINQGLIEGMNIVAPKFKSGEMFVPEVMMSARAMHTGMEMVKPLIADQDVPSKGTIIIGTVAGDLHDIGKNLVVMILGSAGFKVVDLGVDVPAAKFIDAVKEHNPQVLGMSALLTTTMPMMQNTINALQEAGLRDTVKIIVGGAPVSQDFADKIGADGFAADAMAAKEICEKYVN
ncbi:corrinoid protein [Desulfosporosinus nitroreducens]|uniref:Corrinoid protein n=1 Tax=Desulfosporosinus nitroreducens TaxID=2018668 RepID=A0ABT8QLA9_9FIRM|nr:corrinoid protein [Desulfosporosinus nitroreducens]MDO0822127.1 corrinoid protein [Desulfosporosinus nitroreducens]